MVYLFLDGDEYLTTRRIAELKAGLGDAELADLNLTEVEGAHTSAANLLGQASMMPFLAPRRMILARGYLAHLDKRMAASKSAESAAHAEAAQFLGGLRDLPESADLVLVDAGIDKRRALWKGFSLPDGRAVPGLQALSRDAQVRLEEYATPDAKALPNWVAAHAKAKGIAIEMRAAHMLATFVGSNLRQLDNELGKLATYARGRAITADDIHLLVSDASEALIWSLTDALSQRNPKAAMQSLYTLRRGEANAFYLLTMMARQYRIMLKVKEAMPGGRGGIDEHELAKQIGEKSFPVKKAMQQVPGYSMHELVDVLDRLLEADFAMKTGADQEATIDILIAELTQRKRSAA